MTVEKIAIEARRKGIDVIGTGDILQPAWRAELAEKLKPAEDGWFALDDPIERSLLARLVETLRKPLRFVLCTEVSCAPRRIGDASAEFIISSISQLSRPQTASPGDLDRHGDLNEGRPTLNLTSRQLLEIVREFDGCHLAPAHVMNPYFSSLGSQEKHPDARRVVRRLAAAPSRCRNRPHFDPLDVPPDFVARFPRALLQLGRAFARQHRARIHDPRNRTRLRCDDRRLGKWKPSAGAGGCYKFPLELTRYYRNWCGHCKDPFEGTRCPNCRGTLAIGSHDWLEVIGDRKEPIAAPDEPEFHTLLPLKLVLARFFAVGLKSAKVEQHYERLLERLGSERSILSEIEEDALSRVCAPELARAILDQSRSGRMSHAVAKSAAPPKTRAIVTAGLNESAGRSANDAQV